VGFGLRYLGDERAIDLLRKAVQLDPYHPSWFDMPIAAYHFERGEYEEALAAMRKVNLPAFYWAHIYSAAIYAEAGRPIDARSALDKLLRLYPGFTAETLTKELRKFNASDDSIRLWVAALRKAGLPE
jgi:adenylate cyclase